MEKKLHIIFPHEGDFEMIYRFTHIVKSKASHPQILQNDIFKTLKLCQKIEILLHLQSIVFFELIIENVTKNISFN